jgi:hypothetical protein
VEIDFNFAYTHRITAEGTAMQCYCSSSSSYYCSPLNLYRTARHAICGDNLAALTYYSYIEIDCIRGREDGMIGCDGCNRWFHLDCSGLVSGVPDEDWYYSEC